MKNVLSGKILFIVFVVLAGISIVYFYFPPSAHFASSPHSDVVKIYYADNISTAHQTIIDRFNALNKGKIEVVPINLPFSKFSTNERKELLARALRSKNSKLDIFAVDLIWVPRFAKWAEPFPHNFAQRHGIEFLNSAMESCFYDGKLVALPLYMDVGLMYYQRNLLRTLMSDDPTIERRIKQSITWQELVAIGKKLRNNPHPVYLYPGDNFEGLVCSFMELILSQNRDFFNETPIELNTPESRKALQMLVDLIHEYHLTPYIVTNFDGYRTDIYALENDVLFWRSWPGALVQFKHLPAFKAKLRDVEVAAVPHFAGGVPVSIFGGWNLMISNHSKHKKEALAFLLFCLNEQVQMTMYEQGGYLPVLNDVYMDSTHIRKYPEMTELYRLLQNGVHRPYREDYTKWSDVISYYVQQAIKKQISVDEALDTATEIINSKKGACAMTKTNLFGRWRATTASQIRKYHFELKHILLLFIVLLSAQILISFVQKISLERFLAQTQDSYQKDSSERLSNLTATALELLLGTSLSKEAHVEEEKQKIIEAFNIILSQQLLLQGVEDICLLTENGDSISVIDNGQVLYEFFLGDSDLKLGNTDDHPQAIDYYLKQKSDLRAKEMIHSFLSDEQTFHVLVPFVPKGEYAGALYVKNKPNFSLITDEIVSSYNESSLIFSGLIFVGFVAMFLISSSTLRERDIAQEQLFRERESQLKERINRQKEALFTKRIYHAHHKAEKVMGFIKEDLRIMHADNMSEIRNRITKYANFIARVIYDMKWYDPPLQTIRNPLFRTDLNEVVRFIVNEVCLRVTQDSQQFRFRLDLQDTVPLVPINEYVVWEILEPLFQNSLDHNPDGQTTIEVCSRYHADQRVSHITISDDGQGIDPALLVPNEDGIKRLFLENISTKNNENNTGYGCYLAYEISKHRCGWQLDAENLPEGGCRFTITIQHNG